MENVHIWYYGMTLGKRSSVSLQLFTTIRVKFNLQSLFPLPSSAPSFLTSTSFLTTFVPLKNSYYFPSAFTDCTLLVIYVCYIESLSNFLSFTLRGSSRPSEPLAALLISSFSITLNALTTEHVQWGDQSINCMIRHAVTLAHTISPPLSECS